MPLPLIPCMLLVKSPHLPTPPLPTCQKALPAAMSCLDMKPRASERETKLPAWLRVSKMPRGGSIGAHEAAHCVNRSRWAERGLLHPVSHSRLEGVKHSQLACSLILSSEGAERGWGTQGSLGSTRSCWMPRCPGLPLEISAGDRPLLNSGGCRWDAWALWEAGILGPPAASIHLHWHRGRKGRGEVLLRSFWPCPGP